MSNRLADSASPYLLQHADNPVDWWEWGPAAFAEARRRNVPVLLSVGYAACHWCHVMAHESFEDPATAAQMNEGFVNIKVDREERPDVDAVYMEATQAMTGRGGWPMTVFTDHDGKPFFTGTYFHPTDRPGMPGFRSVLTAISEAWRERREEVGGQAARVVDAIGRRLPPAASVPGEDVLAGAVETIVSQYDARHGGFGAAPKFPQQPVLEFLLRVHDRPWAVQARDVVVGSLTAMAAGGIRDQIGGGFARYSVDERWLVPHFEKMLYDNAQLAHLYLWAGVEFGLPTMTDIARDTLEYMLTDLRHSDGGFFSAEDADSEGVEGKFYVWDHAEFMEVAGSDAALVAEFFGVTMGGNFEGANILHQVKPLDEVAARHGTDQSGAAEAVERARRALLARRAGRVRPGLDDKVVAAWNGLAIAALAEAGAVLAESRYLEAAEAAAGFVLDRLVVSGRLRRSWAKGRPGPTAVLEDYAAMAVGLFRLYAATGQARWYQEAIGLVEQIEPLFADPDGGFFTTAADGEPLVVRPKDFFDNPAPSGNSLAAEALTLAAGYSGDTSLWDLAEKTVQAGAAVLERAPSGAGYMLGVLVKLADGPRELAVVGPEPAALTRVAWERFRPDLAVATSREPSDQPPLLVGRGRPGETVAYLCRGLVCDAPVTEPADLRAQLA